MIKFPEGYEATFLEDEGVPAVLDIDGSLYYNFWAIHDIMEINEQDCKRIIKECEKYKADMLKASEKSRELSALCMIILNAAKG